MSVSRTIIPRLDDKRRVEVHQHDDGTWHISLWVRRGQFENMFDLPLLTADEVKVLVGKLSPAAETLMDVARDKVLADKQQDEDNFTVRMDTRRQLQGD